MAKSETVRLTDEESQQVEKHSQLAHWYVCRARRQSSMLRRIPYEDCYQQALLGLGEAIRRYDPDRAELSTYARWHMRAAVDSLLQQVGVVTAPSTFVRQCRKLSEETRHKAMCATRSAVEASAAIDRALQQDDGMEAIDTHDQVEHLLALLPDRLREVVKMRFWANLPHREIAERLGVSRCRVDQLEAQALGILRRRLGLEVQP